MNNSNSSINVKAGQVWETKDSRDKGRRIQIDRVEGRFAHVTTTTPAPGRPNGVGRTSRLNITCSGARYYLAGWQLVKNADGSPA